MDGRATEVDEVENPRGWNPSTRVFSWPATVAFVVWTVVQPVLDAALLHESRAVGILQWIVGIAVILAVVLLLRYRSAAPYRLALSEARSENPDSLVYGIRLDPLKTPVGKEWGDSRQITWGLLRASADGVEITRPSGTIMLQRPWPEVTFSAPGIDIGSGDGAEEWWFAFVGDTGMFAGPHSPSERRSRIEKLQSRRPIAS
jgi:hypothetical protein